LVSLPREDHTDTEPNQEAEGSRGMVRQCAVGHGAEGRVIGTRVLKEGRDLPCRERPQQHAPKARAHAAVWRRRNLTPSCPPGDDDQPGADGGEERSPAEGLKRRRKPGEGTDDDRAGAPSDTSFEPPLVAVHVVSLATTSSERRSSGDPSMSRSRAAGSGAGRANPVAEVGDSVALDCLRHCRGLGCRDLIGEVVWGLGWCGRSQPRVMRCSIAR